MTGPADSSDVATSQAGLCSTCQNASRIVNDRGSVFLLCRRSRTDERFARYPRLPVWRCAGHERDEETR